MRLRDVVQPLIPRPPKTNNPADWDDYFMNYSSIVTAAKIVVRKHGEQQAEKDFTAKFGTKFVKQLKRFMGGSLDERQHD